MISILEQLKKSRKYLPYFAVDPTGFMSKTYVKKTKPRTYVAEQSFGERLAVAKQGVKKAGKSLAGVGILSYGMQNRQKLKKWLTKKQED